LSYQKKKPAYPINKKLYKYLIDYSRELEIPVLYSDLLNFTQGFVVYDNEGKNTLWETVIYSQSDTKELFEGLTRTYSKLLSDGGLSKLMHLTIDRIDYCTFGNSKPFRVKVINKLNDNYDYFYVKQADSSRIYGLELEHILSPNKINYLIYKDTLIEEHIIGIPGDQFIDYNLKRNHHNKVRLAKEFVKFNERCYIRLLGDMRSYNYVVTVTPDFDQNQYRIRAIDFDQQTYEGRRSFYFPHYFKENLAFVKMGMDCLTVESVEQYQREERSFIAKRIKNERRQLNKLISIMEKDTISTPAKLKGLKNEIAEKENNSIFRTAKSMGELVRLMLNNNLEDIESL
tara:strand:+ start:2110 stop:3141 length:1032 start_codon:yes stop_codon:yes gene_type:complete